MGDFPLEIVEGSLYEKEWFYYFTWRLVSAVDSGGKGKEVLAFGGKRKMRKEHGKGEIIRAVDHDGEHYCNGVSKCKINNNNNDSNNNNEDDNDSDAIILIMITL